MTESEILEEAFGIVSDAVKKVPRNSGPVGIHPLYKDTVDLAESVGYHAVKGVFPKKLFENRSPNQSKEEAAYIENNYKQATLPVFMDYIATITRPFGDGNWSIDYQEDDSEYKQSENTFQHYVEKELPVYGSLESFIKFTLPAPKSIDANGYIAVRPYRLPLKSSEGGETVIDPNQLYEPYPIYFESKSVINYTEHYYLFLSSEKSEVKNGMKTEKTGYVFEVYTKDGVYFISQKGRKADLEFEIIPFYSHGEGKFSVHQMKGVPTVVNNQILWISPFSYATDLLDLVVVNKNWLQASIAKCVFPNVVMIGNPCDFNDGEGHVCVEGKVSYDGQLHVCKQCNGSGLKSRLSPLGTILLQPKSRTSDGDVDIQDPLRFVSPDVTALEYIEAKADRDETRARSILKLRNKNSVVKTVNDDVTATEINDDAKSMTAFVKPVSDQIFDIYSFCLHWIGVIRYGARFKEPSLTYPKTFDFKSPEDYLMNLEDAMKNNLPPSFIQMLLIQYINSFYSDDEKTQAIFKLIIEADRLFGLTQNEINLKLAKMTVEKWEDILHTSALSFINDLILENKNFLNQDIKIQKEQLQQKAKDKADEMEPDEADIYGTPEGDPVVQ